MADRPARTDLRADGTMASVDERLSGQTTDESDVRRRLADATRQVIEDLVASTGTLEQFESATALVVQAAAILRDHDRGRAYMGVAEGSLLGEAGGFIDFSPMMGVFNPLAPPMRVERDGPVLRATVTFGAAYEGPPGCVHGGFVAAAFDEVLGLVQSITGQAGMTAHLEVDYRSPTPLNTELRFEGRVQGIEGRKITTVGSLRAGDRLCAEATGLFVTMRPEVFDRLMRSRLGST